MLSTNDMEKKVLIEPYANTCSTSSSKDKSVDTPTTAWEFTTKTSTDVVVANSHIHN